ncbi:MAG: hypothetical protein EON98_10900, partial [Chitinophagaceae bacterium]
TKLNSEGAYKAKLVRDESITKENSYSDLFLDSASLENYIRQQNIESNKAQRMREFYLVRNNQFAWFTSEGLTEQARGLWSLRADDVETAQDSSAKAITKRMDSLLTANETTASIDSGSPTTSESLVKDSTAYMDGSTAMIFDKSDSTLVQTELALTEQLVELTGESNGVITEDNFYWLVPRKRLDAMQLADSVLKGADSVLWKNNQTYTALKNSLRFYHQAAQNGGWDSLTLVSGLKKGATSPAVTTLKKRLAVTGDYLATDTSNIYTDSLETAIKTVQQQFGLEPTGQVTDSLFRELNYGNAGDCWQGRNRHNGIQRRDH